MQPKKFSPIEFRIQIHETGLFKKIESSDIINIYFPQEHSLVQHISHRMATPYLSATHHALDSIYII